MNSWLLSSEEWVKKEKRRNKQSHGALNIRSTFRLNVEPERLHFDRYCFIYCTSKNRVVKFCITYCNFVHRSSVKVYWWLVIIFVLPIGIPSWETFFREYLFKFYDPVHFLLGHYWILITLVIALLTMNLMTIQCRIFVVRYSHFGKKS